jgi:hypothetical protein
VGRDIHRLAGLEMHGRAAEAAEATIGAGSAALAEDPGALAMYQRAGESWRSLDLPLQLGLCMIERDLLAGGAAEADPGYESAEVIFQRLGAAGLLELGRKAAAARAGSGSAPPRDLDGTTAGCRRRFRRSASSRRCGTS